MQKPPEIRRLAEFLDRRVLDEDGGDDQELAGKGDDAYGQSFDDTHLTSFQTGAVSLPGRMWLVKWPFSTAKVDIAGAFSATATSWRKQKKFSRKGAKAPFSDGAAGDPDGPGLSSYADPLWPGAFVRTLFFSGAPRQAGH